MASLVKEHNWCVSHPKELEKHPGKWIAVVGAELITVENSYREAYEKAKQKFPDKIPLVTYVPREGEELLMFARMVSNPLRDVFLPDYCSWGFLRIYWPETSKDLPRAGWNCEVSERARWNLIWREKRALPSQIVSNEPHY